MGGVNAGRALPAGLLAMSVAAVLAVALAAWGGLDRQANDYLDGALQRALIAFATARALNGVISVAQGTELALEPAGVGMSFTPGEVLDPINDLIERFSWVLLAASASLGTQRLLLFASVGPWLSSLLGLALALMLARRWFDWRWPPWLLVSWRRAVVVLLVLRFAVPAVTLVSEGFYAGVLAAPYERAAAELDRASEAARSLDEPVGETTDSLLGRLQGIGEEVRRWPAQVERYQALADQVARSALEMMAVFVVQTVLLPLAGVWLALQTLRAGWRWSAAVDRQSAASPR